MRRIRDNSQVITTTIFGLDPLSANLATSMVAATITAGMMSTNGHWATGLPGQGVNNFQGALPYPVQNFHGAVQPVANPGWTTLGYGANVYAESQLPATNLLAWGG